MKNRGVAIALSLVILVIIASALLSFNTETLREEVLFSPESEFDNFMGVTISPSGHYLQYNGKSQILLGDGGTQVVMMNANVDYEAWINQLEFEDHAGTVVWTFIGPRQGIDPDRFGYELGNYGLGGSGVLPWKAIGSYQYDLSTWEEYYFDRLRDMCSRLQEKEMTMGITVFYGWAKRDLTYHPFYHTAGGPATSGSDITGFINSNPTSEIYTQSFNPSWSKDQQIQWHWERFADKLIQETAHCNNVWFDFRDEWSYDNSEAELVQVHFRNFFESRGQLWGDHSKLASIYSGNDAIPNDFYSNLPAITLEEKPYDAWSVYNNVWREHALEGLHFILHNDERYDDWDGPSNELGYGIFSWDPFTAAYWGVDPAGDASRVAVGFASRFFKNYIIDLDGLFPNDEIIISGNSDVLSNGYSEYVVYLGNSGDVTVDFSSLVTPATIKFYDPFLGYLLSEEVHLSNSVGQYTIDHPHNQYDLVALIQSDTLVFEYESRDVQGSGCGAQYLGQRYWGFYNETGLNGNQDPQFICYNGRFYECGWEEDYWYFAIQARDSAIVGDWQCDLSSKSWVEYEEPVIPEEPIPEQNTTETFTNVSNDSEIPESSPQEENIDDLDEDGIVDWLDLCTNTETNLETNGKGCPLPDWDEFEDHSSDISFEDLNDVDLILANEKGSINFEDKVSLIDQGNPVDLDKNIEISSNKVELNSKNLPGLNKSAIITLYNVVSQDPIILRDGKECADCEIISFNDATLVFSVPHFTTYEITESSPPIPISSSSSTSSSDAPIKSNDQNSSTVEQNSEPEEPTSEINQGFQEDKEPLNQDQVIDSETSYTALWIALVIIAIFGLITFFVIKNHHKIHNINNIPKSPNKNFNQVPLRRNNSI